MEEIDTLHYAFNGIEFPIKVQINEQHIHSIIQSTQIIVLYKDTGKKNKCFMASNGCWYSEREIDFGKYNTIDDLKLKDNSFEDVVRPVLKYLCKNHNPHTSVVITPTSAELHESVKNIGIVGDYVL